MQPIERYGVIALIFLVITVVAVLLWDEGPAPRTAAPATSASGARVDGPSPGPGGVPVVAWTEPRSLRRPREEAVPLAERWRVPETYRGPEGGGGDVISERPLAGPDRRGSGERSGASHRSARVDLGEPDEPVALRTAPPEPGRHRLYVVRPGDTLSEISQGELGTATRWKEIVALNPGLSPERLRVGARLVLPGRAGGGVASPKSAAGTGTTGARPPADAASYVVRENDSLWKIAERLLGRGERWREIATLNPRLDPDHLRVGARLRLPADAGEPRAAGGPAAGPRVASAAAPASHPDARAVVR